MQDSKDKNDNKLLFRDVESQKSSDLFETLKEKKKFKIVNTYENENIFQN